MNKITLGISFSLLLLSAGNLFSQTILFNNGAQVYTGSAAIVHVNGGFKNDGASAVFENNGTMTVANSGTPGTVFLTNASVLQGNGIYKVQQDWENDAVFTSGASTVELYGNLQQFITSNTAIITTFNNLTLSGTGTGNNRKKTLDLNANVGTNGILTLNDRELETKTNTLFVLNASMASVTNSVTPGSEGFVSSDIGGSLSRVTNVAGVYKFPTGSSVGILRYRPVQLTPASSASNTYNARLANNDATIDSYDVSKFDSTELCMLNNLFYHQISRTAGTDNAGIAVFYDQVADGGWTGMAQWNTPTAAMWNDMGAVTATTATPLSDVLKVNWADFSNSPYILSRKIPAAPVLTCSSVCSNSSGNVFSATGEGSSFNWTVPSGTTITSGQGNDSIAVSWNSSPGQIAVTTTAFGCTSDPAFCTVSLFPNPTALFDTTSNLFTFNFSDLSTGGVNSWIWDFGDGGSSTAQNPMHNYTSNGPKNVCLTAISTNGCPDSFCRNINVNVTEFINIPNVFTPDGDGINETFYVTSSGLKEFKMEIYNRWGTKLFTSESPAISWDGKTPSGAAASDGTYFFILKAISVTSKDFSTPGFLIILRDAD